MIRAGRRFPQLVARLREATDFVCYSVVAAPPYSKQYPGTELPFENGLVILTWSRTEMQTQAGSF